MINLFKRFRTNKPVDNSDSPPPAEESLTAAESAQPSAEPIPDEIVSDGELPGGMELNWFNDSGEFIQASVDDAWSSILLGITLTAFLLLLFLLLPEFIVCSHDVTPAGRIKLVLVNIIACRHHLIYYFM